MHTPSRRGFLSLGVVTWLAGCARALGIPSSEREPITRLRRVVTGRNPAGKAILVHNGVSPRIVTTETLPGLALVEVWATDATPTLPVAPVDLITTMTSFVPGPGGTRFRIVQFPGVSTRAFDQEAFRREYLAKAPGLAEAMEAQDSGMHTTDSVDYGVVISGEITLELDDGATVRLKQGDCVVQNGTRHAWRNSTTAHASSGSTHLFVWAWDIDARSDDILAVVDVDRKIGDLRAQRDADRPVRSPHRVTTGVARSATNRGSVRSGAQLGSTRSHAGDA